MVRNSEPSTSRPFTSDSRGDQIMARTAERNQIVKRLIVQMRIGFVVHLLARMVKPQLAAVVVPLQDQEPFGSPFRRAQITHISCVHEEPMPCPADHSQSRTSRSLPCRAIPGRAKTFHSRPCHAESCLAMPRPMLSYKSWSWLSMYCSSAQSTSALNERRCSFAKARIASIMRSGKTRVTFFLGPFSSMLVLYQCYTSYTRVLCR